jgi:transaldolase
LLKLLKKLLKGKSKMSKPVLQDLADFGQSAWLDYISRSLIESGKLKGLIDQGLRGMTSNPSIFNQAIGTTSEYDQKILKLRNEGKSTFEIYDELTIKDIQDATDIFLPTYEKTKRLDGYVSLEINPLLANQVQEQIDEGIRLFKKVNRPNVMIKVPATKSGFAVIEELIANGINVNVTLIFSLEQYEKTVKAYLKGLKRLSEKTSDLSHVRSVASVFISRIDSAIDALLDEKIKNEKDKVKQIKYASLKGRAAVANSRVIFERFKELFASTEYTDLFKKRANLQRVLWGSTSTKNPQYSDIKYVTELIVKPTVNTIPESTLMAFIDHGKVKDAFSYNSSDAEHILNTLKDEGILINQICAKLLDEGLVAFDKAFETLQASIEKKALLLQKVES